MCRRTELLTMMLAAALAVTAAAHSARADDVSAYLERHGLTELLAAHLESEIESAEGELRDELVKRLADVYAALLDSVRDDERRASIEQRSRRLLETADRGGAEELRLALLRAAYRQAERIAEDHRLRRADDADVARAADILADVVPKIIAFEAQLDRLVTQADRRGRAGEDLSAGAGRVERLRQLHGAARFLAAWGLYYQAWLSGRDTALASQAERLFAQLVMVDGPNSDPGSVSEDLRELEPFARSILGMALCRSITRTHFDAIEWLELLSHELTAPAIRRQAPMWRIIVFLEHHQYDLAMRDLEALLDDDADGRTVPSSWLRLAAVHALEAGTGRRSDREARLLVQTTIAELASRGDLQQVLELAERYGIDALGDPSAGSGSGFALHFVRGLLLYREARDLHEASGQEVAGARARDLYSEAIDQLALALDDATAGRHPVAAAASRRMMAWAHFFRAEYDIAWREFEQSSAGLSREEAAEALWMAIASLDRLIESGIEAAPGGSRAAQLDLMDRFLAQHPDSPHAGKLMLRRAVEAEEISPALAEELLSIQPHDDAYLPARHRVTAFLYRAFRNAAARQRPLHAQRFLSVAVPLLSIDDPLTERRLVNVRRVLEVSLTERVERLDAARRAFDELDRIRTIAGADVDAVREEIDYRRVQERLLAGDVAAAVNLAEELWESHEAGSTWARLASRAVFQQAHRQWKAMGGASAGGGAEVDEVLNSVVRFGGRVLREFEDDPSAVRNTGTGILAFHAAVAEASAALYERRGDEERGRAALFLYRKLIEAQPRSIEFLRGAALLAEPLGEIDFAIDCWRRLSAGGDGSERWFEARFKLISLLARRDPARAREVMAQHRQLHPEYGPEPWGQRLRDLDARLSGGEGAS